MDSPFELARALQVILGIGLVIFVHELGHYIAARLCGVRVETFSLGFGPRLIGWRVGPTYYQIALIPLGGFCRMAGEERRLDGLPAAADELPAKSVGARFFIYSGGVAMNVLFGLVVFPILFQIGVPFTRPIVGEVMRGGAAWRARVPEHHEIVAVNGTKVFDFEHVDVVIALGDPEHASLLLRDPRTRAERHYEVEPQKDDMLGFRTLGIWPDAERDEHGHILLAVAPDSPAERAGVKTGDWLVRVVNGAPGLDVRLQLSLLEHAGEAWQLVVEDAAGEREVRVAPELTPRPSPARVGIASRLDVVEALRPSDDLVMLGLREGDHLDAVNDQLILGTGDLERALLLPAERVRARVVRAGRELELTCDPLPPERALALAEDVALGTDPRSTVVVAQPGEAAARAGLQTLDEVLQIDGVDARSWQDVRDLIGRAGNEERAAVFLVRRPGVDELLEIEVLPEKRPVLAYGLTLRQAEYILRSEGVLSAVAFGARYSWRFLEDSWLTLKRMLTRDVSPKNVGGIITISAVSYSLTEAGWIKFFFFLCLVSINLAFLNVLPIPVLDGGHLFFLLIEKIKGSPVSNRVLGTSQAVGVVLLLSLMVYVTYNDLVRWFF